MSGYFQFHETNLFDALQCGNVCPPLAICHLSISSYRICKLKFT